MAEIKTTKELKREIEKMRVPTLGESVGDAINETIDDILNLINSSEAGRKKSLVKVKEEIICNLISNIPCTQFGVISKIREIVEKEFRRLLEEKGEQP